MKGFVVLCLSLLYLVSSANYSLKVDELLTTDVCSDGMVILKASVNLPFNNINIYLNAFHISVTNKDSGDQSYLWCFVQQIESDGEEANIGCFTRRLEEGTYQIDELKEEISFYIGRHEFVISPFKIKDTFKVKSGKEIYFNEPDGEQQLIFSDDDDEEKLVYYLFEYVTDKQCNIYLQYSDDDPIKYSCSISYGRKVVCNINSNKLKSKKYDVYIEDSNGKPKKNYFVAPVQVKLT